MRTISRGKKAHKSASFTATSWDRLEKGDDHGSRGSSTRASSPDRAYESALTPQERKLFLRDDEESVRHHTLSRVNSPSLHTTNPNPLSKKVKADKKAMVGKRMAYKDPDLTMYQPHLESHATRQSQPQQLQPQQQQQPQQEDMHQFRFDKFDHKPTKNLRSNHALPTGTFTTSSSSLRHSQSAQGARSRPPLVSMQPASLQPPSQQQQQQQTQLQGEKLMSRTISLDVDERGDRPLVGLRKAFTAFAPTYTGVHRQQQQQQQSQQQQQQQQWHQQPAPETIGNVDFESTDYHSQAFILRKTGVFTLATSHVVLTRVELETCLRDADTVICHDLNHPRATKDIATMFHGKKLILMGGHVSAREVGYLSRAWLARPRDAASVPYTLQLSHVQCANHRTQLRLIAGLLTLELDDRSINDDVTINNDPTPGPAPSSNPGPSPRIHGDSSIEKRTCVLAMNTSSQFNLRTVGYY